VSADPAIPTTTLPGATAPRAATDWRGELRGLAMVGVAIMAIWTLVAKPFYIPSESMVPGLLTGDRLIVTRFPYGFSYANVPGLLLPPVAGRLFGRLPERGDVVIDSPPNHPGEVWIKRVIALPGDRIALRAGSVVLNGAPLARRAMPDRVIPVDANQPCSDVDYPGRRTLDIRGREVCTLPIMRETLPGGRSYDTVELGATELDDMAELTVPAGRVFLMGDNRDRSADSRASLAEGGLDGPVPVESIGGRAEVVMYSMDGTARWYDPISWVRALRPDRAGTVLHPQIEERR